MAVEPIETHSGQRIRNAPRQRVYRKARWADDWVAVDALWCSRCKRTAAPDVGVATLHFRYGSGLNPGETFFQNVEALDLLGQWIKVVVTQLDDELDDFIWVGRVDDERRTPHGYRIDPETAEEVPCGEQIFTAYAPEVLLTAQPLLTSLVDGLDDPVPAIAFNAGGSGRSRGQRPRGNRALVGADDQATHYRFAANAVDAAEWTGGDIVRYLLQTQLPGDYEGTVRVPITLLESDQVDALDTFTPTVEAAGRTLKDVLDEVISRKRLLGYCLDVLEGGAGESDTLQLRIFTFNDTDVALPDDVTLNANPDQRSLNFEQDFAVRGAILERRGQQVADQILCVGEKRTGTGTFRQDQGTWAAKWSTGEAETFSAGGSGDEDYPAGSEFADWQKRGLLNHAARSAESLRHVFTAYKPPDDWDGRCGAEGYEEPLSHKLDADGDAIISGSSYEIAPFWRPALRFLNETPLVIGVDYSTSAAATIAWPATDQQDFRAPLALMPVADPTDSEVKIYCPLDRNSERGSLPGSDQDRASGSLRPLRDEFAVEIRPGGNVRWAFAGADFTPLANCLDEEAAKFDWRDLILTLTVEFDERLMVRWPTTAADAGDVRRVLRIEVPDARLDYLAPGTVIDVDAAGRLLTTSGGGPLRDDRPRLRTIARLAYAWYGVERNAFTIAWKLLSHQFRIGDLITEVGGAASLQAVRTPITSVEWNFDDGSTTITTDFADLQFS